MPPNTSRYREVRQTVIEDAGFECWDCEKFAVTVRYRDEAPKRGLAVNNMVAVCADCQVLIPADRTGGYVPTLKQYGPKPADTRRPVRRRRNPGRPVKAAA